MKYIPHYLHTQNTTSLSKLQPFQASFRRTSFPMNLTSTQSHRHNVTHTQLRIFKMSSLNDQLLIIRASTDERNHAIEEIKRTLKQHYSYLNQIKKIIVQLLVQNKYSSLENLDSPKDQGSYTDHLVLDTSTTFTSSDKYFDPIK